MNGEIIEIKVTASKATEHDVSKPKAFIHWVAKPIKCIVRTYNQYVFLKIIFIIILFLSRLEVNDEKENSEEQSIAPLQVHKNAFIDKCILNKTRRNYYQFERIGFFGVDLTDSNNKKVIID